MKLSRDMSNGPKSLSITKKPSKRLPKPPSSISKSFTIKLPSLENSFSRKRETNSYKFRSIFKVTSTPIIAATKKICLQNKIPNLSTSSVTQTGSNDNTPKSFNQDSHLLFKNFTGSSLIHLFSVFDGHGPLGHEVSRFLKLKLTEVLEKYIIGLKQHTSGLLYERLMSQSVKELNVLLRNSGIDLLYSGSTLLFVLINGNDCVCCSVGDSRAIVGSFEGLWGCKVLNKEHKPNEPMEKQRIEEAGGRVGQVKDCNGRPVGPVRAWGPSSNSPGLAMSRTLGDRFAEGFGVISSPDVTSLKLDSNDKFIVVATDGLWDAVENSKVVEIVARHWDTRDVNLATEELVKYATKRSKKLGGYVDDITIIVVFRN